MRTIKGISRPIMSIHSTNIVGWWPFGPLYITIRTMMKNKLYGSGFCFSISISVTIHIKTVYVRAMVCLTFPHCIPTYLIVHLSIGLEFGWYLKHTLSSNKILSIEMRKITQTHSHYHRTNIEKWMLNMYALHFWFIQM